MATQGSVVFDVARMYTESKMKDMNGEIKRKVACATCRKARAKCDAEFKLVPKHGTKPATILLVSPCTKCIKKNTECKPALSEKDTPSSTNTRNSPKRALALEEPPSEPNYLRSNTTGIDPTPGNTKTCRNYSSTNGHTTRAHDHQVSNVAESYGNLPTTYNYQDLLLSQQQLWASLSQGYSPSTASSQVQGVHSDGGGQYLPSYVNNWEGPLTEQFHNQERLLYDYAVKLNQTRTAYPVTGGLNFSSLGNVN
ncbi:hypothetical protein SCHPADRAFT_226177 [Schizopora paradoxa]|uniref:Zn(2)-C6 fungal-type domain-containing protein n=1 Tax=Schizopora paradoxa TaxID=27342 RepID=A0A0H2RVY0_9AGAM|nr:hypothetical protein SCHPADRAFT_226177 [Schizopora paradoxa]